MRDYRAATISELASLTEAELQSRIVEPLLRCIGFTHVRDTSGPNDRGKDLIAIKPELGKPKLYAIQIKKLNLTGKHSQPNSLTNSIIQLRQLFREDVIDPSTNSRRLPDRCIFITPFEINRSALESAFRQLGELERQDITIIDGPILVDQILAHIPDAIRKLNMELQYRLRVAETANRIAESSAFGLQKDLQLDTIYVELAITCGAADILKIAKSEGVKRDTALLRIHGSTLADVEAFCRNNALVGPRTKNPDRYSPKLKPGIDALEHKAQEKLTELRQQLTVVSEESFTASTISEEIRHLEDSSIVQMSIEPTAHSLRSRIIDFVPRLNRLGASSVTAEEVTQVLRDGSRISRALEDFQKLPLVKEYWPHPWKSSNESSNLKFPRVSGMLLLKVHCGVFITGGPGAGKTTLVRRVAQQIASNSGQPLPILLYLIRVKSAGDDSLVAECLKEVRAQGLKITQREFERKMKAGFFRVILDGLDETGAQSADMLRGIELFSCRFPKTHVILTGRDTFEYPPWSDAAYIRISPFDDDQLTAFVKRWFSSEPSKVDRLTKWFCTNTGMKEAARTPMIAALLCSLASADAELPSTETELYEHRFDMLLGRWERAKGIEPLSPELRRRYWHFLLTLAFEMHLKGIRNVESVQALEIARRYFSKAFHSEPLAMLADCIHRGILEQNVRGELSFGHLTYQEYLAAKKLVQDNSIQFIWKHIHEDWWAKAFGFYASIRGDLSLLLDAAPTLNADSLVFRRIASIIHLAPLTPENVLRRLLQPRVAIAGSTLR